MEAEDREDEEGWSKFTVRTSPQDTEFIENVALFRKMSINDAIREALRFGFWYEKELIDKEFEGRNDAPVEETTGKKVVEPDAPYTIGEPMYIDLSWGEDMQVNIVTPLRKRIRDLPIEAPTHYTLKEVKQDIRRVAQRLGSFSMPGRK